MSKNEVHISSLVVRAQPNCLDILIKQISAFDEAEVYGSNSEEKIVEVVETSTGSCVGKSGVDTTLSPLYRVLKPLE